MGRTRAWTLTTRDTRRPFHLSVLLLLDCIVWTLARWLKVVALLLCLAGVFFYGLRHGCMGFETSLGTGYDKWALKRFAPCDIFLV